MKLVFAERVWEDYRHWQATDPDRLKRVNRLIRDTLRSPFEGIGHPEPLRHELAGLWSRRIDREHRLVYFVRNRAVHIVQARYHYG